jgi:hypothetical protein
MVCKVQFKCALIHDNILSRQSEEKGFKNQIGQGVCFLLFTLSFLIRKLHAHSMSLEPTISSSTLFN